VNFSRRTGLLLVLAFIVSLPAVTPRIYASDEIEYFSFLRSLWFDHDLSFDNEYRHFADAAGARLPMFRETFLTETTTTGHRKTFATIGSALLWAPFYAVADAGVHAARLAGMNVATDGYSQPYVAAVAYGSAVYGLLALLLAAHACRLIFGSPGRGTACRAPAEEGPLAPAVTIQRGTGGAILRRADGAPPVAGVDAPEEHAACSTPQASISFATFAIWLGTPLVFYMYVAPPFAHAASAFAVAAFVVTWLRVRCTWSRRGMVALGALAALMTMVREQDVFFVGGVALDLAWTVVARMRSSTAPPAIRRLIVNTGIGMAAGVVAYLPQAIAYVVVNGSLRPSPQVTRKMTWTAPHAWQVLASPENGFLFWTPLAALALAGLVVMATRAASQRRVAICLLVMAALQVYVVGAIESWTVAGAFGQRRFVGLTLVLAVGMVALVEWLRGRASRRLLCAVVIACAWWNIALIVQFGTGMMDRKRLTLADNAYNAFVVVPREMPRLVYRYAFDRKSFYAAPPR
jgi:hypothetical protein